MSSGVNHNINGANQVKYCSLVKPNIGFFSHVQLRKIYWNSLQIIDGEKPEIEGLNHDIDGAKCQIVEYFQSSRVKYSLSYEIDGANYEMDGVKHEIDGVNRKMDGGNHVKQSSTLQYT